MSLSKDELYVIFGIGIILIIVSFVFFNNSPTYVNVGHITETIPEDRYYAVFSEGHNIFWSDAELKKGDTIKGDFALRNGPIDFFIMNSHNLQNYRENKGFSAYEIRWNVSSGYIDFTVKKDDTYWICFSNFDGSEPKIIDINLEIKSSLKLLNTFYGIICLIIGIILILATSRSIFQAISESRNFPYEYSDNDYSHNVYRNVNYNKQKDNEDSEQKIDEYGEIIK